MCYVEVCSISVDFYSHTPPQDFEVFGGLDKVRIGEENQAYREEQFHGLRLSGFDTSYSRHSSLARAGYEVFTETCLTNLLLEEL